MAGATTRGPREFHLDRQAGWREIHTDTQPVVENGRSPRYRVYAIWLSTFPTEETGDSGILRGLVNVAGSRSCSMDYNEATATVWRSFGTFESF